MVERHARTHARTAALDILVIGLEGSDMGCASEAASEASARLLSATDVRDAVTLSAGEHDQIRLVLIDAAVCAGAARPLSALRAAGVGRSAAILATPGEVPAVRAEVK